MQRRYATPEPLSERVIKQLARKFRYFDVEVTSELEYLSNFGLKIYKENQTNPHQRDTIQSVAGVRKSGKWFEIESKEGAPPYIKKLEGKKFGSRPQLEMAVRHEAFEYEAHRLLVKEAEDVLRKEAEDVLRRNSPSNDSAR